MATLEEVGAAAGVSRATVSRVINGSPKVSDDVRASVERAIKKLGYTPNRAARSLVTRRTDTLALVVCEPEARVFSDPFFAAVVRGLSAAAADVDKNVVLVLAQDDAERERARRYLRPEHVDGVVLMSLHGDDPLPRQLARAGMPTVLVGRPFAASSVPFVDADNRGGARLAVDHLLARGRKRIATITGPSNMSAGIDRADGYRDALMAAGVTVNAARITEGDFGEESGHAAMRKLLKAKQRPDSVFAASDLMAAGAMRALRDAGLDVPGDVAVVGFDDVPLAAHTQPQLTTVRQPLDEMSKATAALLLQRIAEPTARVKPVVCATELVVRSSS